MEKFIIHSRKTSESTCKSSAESESVSMPKEPITLPTPTPSPTPIPNLGTTIENEKEEGDSTGCMRFIVGTKVNLRLMQVVGRRQQQVQQRQKRLQKEKGVCGAPFLRK